MKWGDEDVNQAKYDGDAGWGGDGVVWFGGGNEYNEHAKYVKFLYFKPIMQLSDLWIEDTSW